MAQLGLIGLGIMGRPMALNLLAAGHTVHVYARREAALAPFRDHPQAVIHASPAEVARQAEVVFTVVSDTPDVEAVLFGPQGLAEGLRAGATVIDMSTISATATREFASRLAAQGVDMLDAPVSGGEVGAIQGTLSIMVGGRVEVFERVKPWLEILGKNIVHVGEQGAGQVAKACNQVVVAVTIEAVAEALTFAAAHGVDGNRVREALLGGFAGSRILEIHGKRMLSGDYTPGFKTSLHAKDMRIVAAGITEQGLRLPCASLVGERLQALAETSDAESDSSVLFKLLSH
ncbi:NAD(P)-dependent oxidoreductase [Chitinimonas lacunae]|uniref:NAD(P)-dependent oxidoreductase n=1 Tax=Chitinimonas lacunae TaxID=1963018 RepID=A0ABV8MTQ9_9NEIS